MSFCEFHGAARWLGLTAIVSLGAAAHAQQTIQFSKPAGQDTAGKANFFMGNSGHNPATFNAPSSLFGGSGPSVSFDVLPGSPRPIVSMMDAHQMQKAWDAQKNWTLMTPEEILNIPTVESILGVTDSQDAKLSTEERFLRRQENQYNMGASNAMLQVDALLLHNNSSGFDPVNNLNDARQDRFGGGLNGLLEHSLGNSTLPPTARNLNSLLSSSSSANSASDINVRPDSPWNSPFDAPPQVLTLKPTPEQQANLDRFHALLDPPPPDKPATFSLPVAAPNPNMQVMPAFNPSGQTFGALPMVGGRPMGLQPLSGGSSFQQPKAPTPLVQPPPWMQQNSQPSFNNLPQRQF